MGLLNRNKERPKLDWETIHSGGSETARAIDEEAGVVIYRFTHGRRGGLSTVPIEETDLQL